jgi:hypothetical protein
MRIGSRIGSALRVVLVAVSAAFTAAGADIERVRPVPLGGTLPAQSGDAYYGVYVPTRFGGALTVKTTAGTVDSLTGPDGRVRANGEDVGNNQHGWYTFKITGADKPYAVETSFVQVGQSARTPWNFYYWPTKSDAVHEPWAGGNGRVDTSGPAGDDELVHPYGAYVAPGEDIIRAGPNGLLETAPAPGDTSTWFPNLYDDLTWRGADGTWYTTPSPLLKYDQLFGTDARRIEASTQQSHDIQRWMGHCLGGAMASIMLNEPTPAPGSGFTRDELKALWAELGENHFNHRIGDNINNIPPGPPRPGYDECDRSAPHFQAMLESHIRGRRQALLGNLRAFPPNGKINEVWNHGIGKYTAKYHAIPGEGARRVRLEVELVSNSGSNLNNSDNKPRINTYEYIVVYTPDGLIDESPSGAALADWVGLGGEAIFAPLNLMEVVESRWQGHNALVTEANVRSLDLANGGGGRFLGAAPNFRPVGSYEGFGGGSRFPFFARRGGGNGDLPDNGGESSSPRRGLFRFFGR